MAPVVNRTKQEAFIIHVVGVLCCWCRARIMEGVRVRRGSRHLDFWSLLGARATPCRCPSHTLTELLPWM